MTKSKAFEYNISQDTKEIKKMPWQETMTKLEDAVKVAQEKEQTLSDATAEFNVAQKEYNEAVMLVDSLRNELNNTMGSLFNQNPRVKVS